MSFYYINMKEAHQRRINFQSNFSNLNISQPLTRVEAIDGEGRHGTLSKGEIGCFLSHAKIINSFENNSNIFIFEDDSIITKNFTLILPELLANNSFDIVFLNGGASPFNTEKLLQLFQLKNSLPDIYSNNFNNFKLYDATELYLHGTSSYMLSPSGILKLRILYEKEISTSTFNIPIDLFLRKKIFDKSITGAVIFPFLTGIDFHSDTQISDRISSSLANVNDACANLFVADAELQKDLKLFAFDIFRKYDSNIDYFIASQLIQKGLFDILKN
jgi:GR25 family glycosyltransferase involved in LPS biosynthesis